MKYPSLCFAALGLAGCVTPAVAPLIVQIGPLPYKLKSPAVVDLTAEDWQANPKSSCVTHIYSCQIDKQGKVASVKALDHSETAFQQFTEDALKSWTFEGGNESPCFVEFIYEKDQPTRILMLPEDMATSASTNLKARRKVATQDTKKLPLKLKQNIPHMPKEAALRGISGKSEIKFDLNDAGEPENIRVITSKPIEEFGQVSVKAIKSWRYQALSDAADSKRKDIEVSIHFMLGNAPIFSSCDLGVEVR